MSWPKGKPRSEETKKRISQTSKKHWQDKQFREKARKWWDSLSKTEKEIATRKSTDAMKAFWQRLTPEEKLSINANGRKSASQVRPTSIELTVEELLKSLNIVFETQKPIGKFIVDIFIPSKGLVVECDGDYWHSLPKAIKRDREKDKYIRSLGYQIIRIPEYRIKHNMAGIQTTIFDICTETEA